MIQDYYLEEGIRLNQNLCNFGIKMSKRSESLSKRCMCACARAHTVKSKEDMEKHYHSEHFQKVKQNGMFVGPLAWPRG